MTAPWPAERIEQLKTHVNNGMSGGQIAEAMGVTRNTILGKIHRLKLQRPSKISGLGRRIVKWTAELDEKFRDLATHGMGPRTIGRHLGLHHSSIRNRAATLGVRLARNVSGRKKQIQPRIPFVPLPTPVDRTPLHLTLLELDNFNCRWPYGDKPYTFCGHKRSDGSYCAAHKRRAWV